MQLPLKIGFTLLSFTVAYYLLLPAPKFPPPPENSIRSREPGDLESVYRRAYYTNFSRSEILNHYARQFSFPGQFLLNYPPEDAYPQIRDQTKSSWLQELVHPWRESLFINGFYPTKPTEQIYIDNVHYLNKITLRYTPSHPVSRLTVFALSLVGLYLLKHEYAKI